MVTSSRPCRHTTIDDERHVNACRLHANEQILSPAWTAAHREPAREFFTTVIGREIDAGGSTCVERSAAVVLTRGLCTWARTCCLSLGPDERSSRDSSGRKPAEQVLDVDHAARIVERLAEQRNARYAGFLEQRVAPVAQGLASPPTAMMSARGLMISSTRHATGTATGRRASCALRPRSRCQGSCPHRGIFFERVSERRLSRQNPCACQSAQAITVEVDGAL